MTFYNTPNFPDDISYGSKGGPRFSTTIIQLKSGHEQRNINWLYPLHMYDVSYGVKTQEQMASLREFFMAMFGQAHTFRFKDWHDYTTHADGNSAPTQLDFVASVVTAGSYQIVKRYDAGTATMKRQITKPVLATVSVAWDGSAVAPGDLSIDETTGIFTITGSSATVINVTQAVSALVSTISAHGFITGDTVYFSNITGMTELNGNRYTIVYQGSRKFKLNVNSTGFGAYVSGGYAIGYPGSTEASTITAGCEFDVPCRFDSDLFDPVHDDYNITQLQLQVAEVRD